MKIRKIVVTVEDTLTEMGQSIDPPTRRAAATARWVSDRDGAVSST